MADKKEKQEQESQQRNVNLSHAKIKRIIKLKKVK